LILVASVDLHFFTNQIVTYGSISHDTDQLAKTFYLNLTPPKFSGFYANGFCGWVKSFQSPQKSFFFFAPETKEKTQPKIFSLDFHLAIFRGICSGTFFLVAYFSISH